MKDITEYIPERIAGRISEETPLHDLQGIFLKEFIEGFPTKSVDELLKDFSKIIVKEFLDDVLENFLAPVSLKII